MNAWTLTRRSLWFYRRTHLGVVLGTAVAAAVLIGALAVGDSLRASLRDMALARLGDVEAALSAPDRYFADALGADIAKDVHCEAAAVLSLVGSAENQAGTVRANQVAILGVDERFWRLGRDAAAPPLLKGDEGDQVVLNAALAERLGAKAGDIIFLRLPRPDMLPVETALSGAARRGLQLSLTVKAVAGDEQFGRYSLRSGAPPLNGMCTASVPVSTL